MACCSMDPTWPVYCTPGWSQHLSCRDGFQWNPSCAQRILPSCPWQLHQSRPHLPMLHCREVPAVQANLHRHPQKAYPKGLDSCWHSQDPSHTSLLHHRKGLQSIQAPHPAPSGLDLNWSFKTCIPGRATFRRHYQAFGLQCETFHYLNSSTRTIKPKRSPWVPIDSTWWYLYFPTSSELPDALSSTRARSRGQYISLNHHDQIL